jgi:hypothetical protein
MPTIDQSSQRPLRFTENHRQVAQNRRHAHFPARQNNAERATRTFPLAGTTRSTPRALFRSPKQRRNTHAGLSAAPKQHISTVNPDKSII